MRKVLDFDPRKRQTRKSRGSAPALSPAWRRQMCWLPSGVIIAGLVFFSVFRFASPIPGCDIKGNISVHGGERIYHMPGKEYYSQTHVDLLNGERWFCSEESAREAGWRKAYK